MNRVQHIAFIIFLVGLPLIYPINSGQIDMRVFQEHAFQYMGMCLIVLFVGNIWMSLFFLLNVALLFNNGFDVGQSYVQNIFIALMLFMVSRKFFKAYKFDQVARYLLITLAVSLIFVVLQSMSLDPIHVTQDSTGVKTPHMPMNDPVGSFFLKSHHGIFLALMIPIVASINVWLALPMLAIIWFMQSSASMLAGLAALFFYSYYTKKRFSLTIPIPQKPSMTRLASIPIPVFHFFKAKFKPLWCVLLAVAFIPIGVFYVSVKDFRDDPQMFMSRFNMWHSAVYYSFKRPIGYGPDSWRNITKHKKFMFMGDQDRRSAIGHYRGQKEGNPDLSAYDFVYYHPNRVVKDQMNAPENYNKRITDPLFSPNWWDNAHNEYLTVLFQYGIAGVVIMFFFMRDIYRRFRYSPKSNELVMISAMLLVFFISSTTQFPLEVARLAYLFPVLLGGFFALTDTKEIFHG